MQHTTVERRLSAHDQEIITRFNWDLDSIEARASAMTGLPAVVEGLRPLMFDALIAVGSGPYFFLFDGPNDIYSAYGPCGLCGSRDADMSAAANSVEDFHALAARHAEARRTGTLAGIVRFGRRYITGCTHRFSSQL